VPYGSGERLPGERASRLGHLDVLKSPLVKKLCESFEDGSTSKPATAAQWNFINCSTEATSICFGVDGFLPADRIGDQALQSNCVVKTALVMLDQPALNAIDKAEPHPFMIRDILARSQVYHATVSLYAS